MTVDPGGVPRRAAIRRIAAVVPAALGACALMSGPRIESHRGSFPLRDLLAGLVDAGSRVVVPAGLHRLPNPVVVHGARGSLSFAPGAQLRCERAGHGGMHFFHAEDLSISGLDLDWPEPPTARSHAGAGLFFSDSRRLTLARLSVVRAPGGGIQFDRCDDVTGDDLRVHGTSADGIHAANSTGLRLRGIDTRDTGDDGLAFVGYDHGRPGRDVRVESVRIAGAMARGIAVLGYEDVSISDVEIVGTRVSGVLIGTDHFYRTHRAGGVRLARVRIVDAGTLDARTPNKFGIELNDCGDVELADLSVESPAARGVSGIDAGTVRIDDVRIRMDVPAGAAIDLRRCAGLRARALAVTLRAGLPMSLVEVGRVSLIDAALASDTPGPDGHLLKIDTPDGPAYRRVPRQLELTR